MLLQSLTRLTANVKEGQGARDGDKAGGEELVLFAVMGEDFRETEKFGLVWSDRGELVSQGSGNLNQEKRKEQKDKEKNIQKSSLGSISGLYLLGLSPISVALRFRVVQYKLSFLLHVPSRYAVLPASLCLSDHSFLTAATQHVHSMTAGETLNTNKNANGIPSEFQSTNI